MRKIVVMALACAGLAVAVPAFADDKAVIQARDDQYSAVFNRSDAPGLGAFYTSDTLVLPPDNSIVKGRAAAQTFFAGAFGHGKIKLTATDVVRLSPTYIREFGIATFTVEGDAAAKSSSYVVVWRKVGGTWQIGTDIFH